MLNVRRKKWARSTAALLSAIMLAASAPIAGAASVETYAAVDDATRAGIEASLYNAEYYASANEDVAVALDYEEEAMYQHWLNYGKAEGRNASMVFNAKYYLEVNPEVAAQIGNDYAAAYEHFVSEGLLAGLESSPVFSVKYYLQANQDVAQAFNGDYISAAQHFNLNAIAEGRSGSGNFDYTVYRACNTDVEELYGDYIEGYYIHYINHGRAEGRTGGLAAGSAGSGDSGNTGGSTGSGGSGNTGGSTGSGDSGYADSTILGTVESVTEQLSVKRDVSGFFSAPESAGVAPVSQFVTAEGGYGVAYHGSDTITILLYDKELSCYRRVSIAREEGYLGAVTCDENGCFYAVYGIPNSTDDTTKEVMRIIKYSSDGTRLDSISLTGIDAYGAKTPFLWGNCSVRVKDGLLVCIFASGRYDGHQVHIVLYVDTVTMQQLDIETSITGHSFDQQVITTIEGGFLFAAQSDANERGFNILKLTKNFPGFSDWNIFGIAPFHFRECVVYQHTFAQLGGISELRDAYVLVGASERTLSLDIEPEGYNEVRDLFIQYLKKDFIMHDDPADRHTVAGETREAVGTKPEDPSIDLRLEEDVVDYGVVWLTAYEDEYSACEPKVVATEMGEVVILWQKVCYATEEALDTYYMVLDSKGNCIQGPVALGAVPLSKDEPAVYLDGSIYWSVAEETGLRTYRFTVYENMLSRLENEASKRIFDAEYYLEKYPALADTVGTDEMDLYLYWMNVGISLKQSASPVLDPAEYMLLNADVAEAVDYDFTLAIQHFLDYGIYEGRSGSREFDYTVYADCNTDVAAAFEDDMVGYYSHYVKHGRAEGRTARLITTEEEKPLESVTIVPEGTKKFMTPECVTVVLQFDEEGRITSQTYYGSDGALQKEYCYDYYEGTNRWDIGDASLRSTMVSYTEYESGAIQAKTVDATVGAFEYWEMVSENADGTITLQFKRVELGTYREEEYYESGLIMRTLDAVYDVDGEPVSVQEYYYDEFGLCTGYYTAECEEGRIVRERSSDGLTESCKEYEYYENGELKREAAYLGADRKPQYIYEFDESGKILRQTTYTYGSDGNGSLEEYEVIQCEAGSIISITRYDKNGQIVSVINYA